MDQGARAEPSGVRLDVSEEEEGGEGAGVAVRGGRKLGAGLKLSQGYFLGGSKCLGERPRLREEGEREKGKGERERREKI